MKKLFSEIPYIEGETIVLRKIEQSDAPGLQELVNSEAVYRYLPTFLFEKKYDDITYVIDHLYDECFEESIILGVFKKREAPGSDAPGDDRVQDKDVSPKKEGAAADEFCGLAEMYGFRDEIHKISVGGRLLERYWGQGVAAEILKCMVGYLYNETDIEIITASSMVDNQGSAALLRKNGFDLVSHAVPEDWGFDEPMIVDKWIR